MNVELLSINADQLSDRIDRKLAPVRRSSHVGNQPPCELAVITDLPSGVDVLLVDTIRGDDRSTRPDLMIKNDDSIRLLSRRKAARHVVSSLVGIDPVDNIERSLIDIHDRPFVEHGAANRPVLMTRFFRQYPDAFRATIAACMDRGQIRRIVDEGGIIHEAGASSIRDDEIFGLTGDHGIMIPLNGMMALDMLISKELGSDDMIHIAGDDMIQYVQDPMRMQEVAMIIARARDIMALPQFSPRYQIFDIERLPKPHAVSQHSLYGRLTNVMELSA